MPTIFESLNARQLSPRQVAETFVPTDNFYLLRERNHNVIIGPRGSGKTTLLKMLQIPALCNWKHQDAESMTDNIDFISAFVPTDIAWQRQWSLLDVAGIDDDRASLIKNAIFTTHALRAVVEAFRDCRDPALAVHPLLDRFYVDLPREREAELCKELASRLGLHLRIASLEYIEIALRGRLVQIGDLINRYRLREFGEMNLGFIFASFSDSLSFSVNLLNYYADRANQNWALLFDELELAPPEIRRQLISDLRSTDPRIYFKLSMSPYSEDFDLFARPEGPSATNDYKPIHLWYSHKEHARPFCASLFHQMIRSLNLDDVSPTKVFSHSKFQLGNYVRSQGLAAYASGTPLHKRFASLREKDETFRTYLDDRQIDIDHMEDLSEDARASQIRKITNIVCVRDSYRRTMTLSSRRTAALYTGATSLFDITEGNPRLFIGIIGPLLNRYAETRRKISTRDQARAIEQAVHRFRALLSTIPASTGSSISGVNGLNQLLDRIGAFFFDRVVRDDFVTDPPTSFTVDSNTPNDVEIALGRALNAGAIVYMEDDPGNSLLRSLKGKRFRLSYLLAPHYKLPLLASKSRNLSGILQRQSQEPPVKDMFNELAS